MSNNNWLRPRVRSSAPPSARSRRPFVDIKGKTLGVPVFELLDGKYRDRVEFNTDWGAVMAASMVMTAPIALPFLFFQNLLVDWLTAGARLRAKLIFRSE